ncbi:MAG: hypothetical protein ACJ754_05705 [Pyrinomonadaceae bacterium]
MIFKNQKVGSLSQKFTLKLKGTADPTVLPGVPAFPLGLAEVIIKPNKYRLKNFFYTVFTGATNSINEVFFVDPDGARPTQMDFQDLVSKPYATDLLHTDFPPGFTPVSQDNSFKSRDEAAVYRAMTR